MTCNRHFSVRIYRAARRGAPVSGRAYGTSRSRASPGDAGGESPARRSHTHFRVRRLPSRSHSGGGRVARDTALSHEPGGSRSLVLRSTLTFERWSLPTMLRKNATRLPLGSTKVMVTSGSSIAMTRPGAPAPLPTSIQTPASGDEDATIHASATDRSTSSSGVRAAVRSIFRFHPTSSSRYAAIRSENVLRPWPEGGLAPARASVSHADSTRGRHPTPSGSSPMREHLPRGPRAR